MAALLPLIPMLVQIAMSIADAIRGSQDTPAEQKAKLDAISVDLKAISMAVAAVELPSK